jgi:hypothetical protein
MQIFYHNIGFCEKRQFFRRKLAKIAENCDHNIDPWSHWLFSRHYVRVSDELLKSAKPCIESLLPFDIFAQNS